MNPEWLRTDNIEPSEVGDLFQDIREFAELKGFDNEDDVEDFVFDILDTDFTEFAKRITREDVWAEYYPFEAYDSDEEDPGYAVYIHLSIYAREVLKEVYAEYYISFIFINILSFSGTIIPII